MPDNSSVTDIEVPVVEISALAIGGCPPKAGDFEGAYPWSNKDFQRWCIGASEGGFGLIHDLGYKMTPTSGLDHHSVAIE
jgi:hypothetical protein